MGQTGVETKNLATETFDLVLEGEAELVTDPPPSPPWPLAGPRRGGPHASTRRATALASVDPGGATSSRF